MIEETITKICHAYNTGDETNMPSLDDLHDLACSHWTLDNMLVEIRDRLKDSIAASQKMIERIEGARKEMNAEALAPPPQRLSSKKDVPGG